MILDLDRLSGQSHIVDEALITGYQNIISLLLLSTTNISSQTHSISLKQEIM